MTNNSKILILNCGSSSVKWALFTFSEKELCRGIIEKIGEKGKTHQHAIQEILCMLSRKKLVSSFEDIHAVGHRVVHGGDFVKSCIINRKIMKKIQEAAKLAPLHNPHNIEGIHAAQKLLPNVKNIAMFDTAFHRTIPDYGATYGIPLSLSKKYKIKKYGFHGISYQYICEELKRKLGKLPARLIVCHLGNGSSITAIKNGKSIDTSMGFTPMEGLLMGTRCGDIDPGIFFYLVSLGEKNIEKMLIENAGLKGIAGTNDMRNIWKQQKKSKNARLALEMYCYRLQKYIGTYAAVLRGVDCLVFTAGIGQNAWWAREKACSSLSFLGIKINNILNKQNKERISTGKTIVFVLATNEEKMVAREVIRLL